MLKFGNRRREGRGKRIGVKVRTRFLNESADIGVEDVIAVLPFKKAPLLIAELELKRGLEFKNPLGWRLASDHGSEHLRVSLEALVQRDDPLQILSLIEGL